MVATLSRKVAHKLNSWTLHKDLDNGLYRAKSAWDKRLLGVSKFLIGMTNTLEQRILRQEEFSLAYSLRV